jgi:hypothetical protein
MFAKDHTTWPFGDDQVEQEDKLGQYLRRPTMEMKKLLLGVAAGLTFGSVSSVYAAAPILFDQTGSAGAGVAINTFDWAPDNALVIGALSTTPVGGPINVQLVAQGKLGTFIAPGNVNIPVASGEFTFQASFFETVTGIGTGTVGTSTGAGASSFNMYFNPTAGTANQIAGTGYGALLPGGAPVGGSVLILSGTLVSLNGNFTDTNILNNVADSSLSSPTDLLDQFGGTDNQNGTLSHNGNGSTTVRVDVSFENTNFFRSNITSLLIDLQDVSNNSIPFQQADPSNQVFGSTPFYTLVSDGAGGFVRVDGAVVGVPDTGCLNGGQDENGNNSARCDLHLQTDASTTFNPVPEPGSLALLGGALAAISMIRRRKRTA